MNVAYFPVDEDLAAQQRRFTQDAIECFEGRKALHVTLASPEHAGSQRR